MKHTDRGGALKASTVFPAIQMTTLGAEETTSGHAIMQAPEPLQIQLIHYKQTKA
jgi:hypothetical protein